MKIGVQLYGTLGRLYPGYTPSEGIEVEILDGAKIGDLLTILNISGQRGVVVTRKGRILDEKDEIQDGDSIRVLQTVHGG